MRRRTALRSYALARLILCLILLAQSTMASASYARSATATDTSLAATKPRVSTNAQIDAPISPCAASICTVYLPWLIAGVSTSSTAPTNTPTATPTSTPTATPTSTPIAVPTATPIATPIPPASPASDTQPPSAPSNLRATSSTTATISLAWDAASDNVAVTAYALYSSSTLVLTTTSLFATVSALTAGTTYTFTVIAHDAAGNTSASTPLSATTDAAPQPQHIDTQAPTTPTNLRSMRVTHGTVTLAWDASQDDVAVDQYDVYADGVWIDSTAETSFTVTNLAAISDHSFAIAAYDTSGNVSDPSDALSVTTTLPADASTLASPVDQTVTSDIASDTAFIYGGDDPIQSGVAPRTIQADHIAILRGRVITRDGVPIAGVAISVFGHEEYGRTVSRADGAFDLAVNGGGRLVLDYQKEGYLPAQRQVLAPWRDYVTLPDVALVMLDQAVTTISLEKDSSLQAAAGSVVTDTDGVRQALLIFPAYTTATLELPDGSEQPLTTLHVRATEYTVGEHGLAAMPGTLPIESGYTYAVDYSVDEALTAGARQVRFNQPIVGYVENFLHFPIGLSVPAGTYDREQAAWVASDSGRIIKIVGITNGLADLDVTGSGNLDDPAWLGISDDEREELAKRYQVGQELWRVLIPHFSPWDFNWPFGPPSDATGPNAGLPSAENPEENPCQRAGSIIECQNQILGEQIDVTGTPYQLHYSSERVPGHMASNAVRIPLSGSDVPASLARIELEVNVAGRHFSQTFSNAPNQSYIFTWDKKDAYGRKLQGKYPVTARIGFVYPGSYQRTERFGRPGNGTPITGDSTREEVTLWKDWSGAIGSIDLKPRGLGGWSLDVQHVYDPTGHVLDLGSGGRQGAQTLGPVVVNHAFSNQIDGMALGTDGWLYFADSRNQTIWRSAPLPGNPFRKIPVAGDGIDMEHLGGFSGDGGLARNAQLNQPKDVAFGPDGSLYIADYHNNRIRRVTPDGMITTFAGGGQSLRNGDLAINRFLSGPTGVEVSPDGTVYIADRDNNSIYRVGTDGLMTKIAGFNPREPGDPNLAIYAQLNRPSDIALAPDGSLYIAETGSNIIRHIDLNGFIHTVAGDGRAYPAASQTNGDGGPATQAVLNAPHTLAVARDGSLYILEQDYVRWIRHDGIIATVVGHAHDGRGESNPSDGTPALQTELWYAGGIALGPDESLYVSTNFSAYRSSGPRVLHTRPAMPGFTLHEFAIPSSDGKQFYQFDASGRHLRTLDALTNVALYTFTYDSAGQLASVTDRDGLITTIERDAGGNPLAIVAPHGQRTPLTLNGNVYLESIANPAGETTHFTYTDGGLLTSLADPRGGIHSFEYDPMGRLTRDTNPVGGFTALARVDSTNGYTVTVTNALGDSSILTVETLPSGAHRRVNISPDGAVTSSVGRPDGIQESTDAQGNVTTIVEAPDPRWGWMAPFVSSIAMRTSSGQVYYTQTASRSTTFFYVGQLLTVRTQTDTGTTNGHTTITVYDAVARTITSTDAAGKRTVMSLDGLGRLVDEQTTNLAPKHYIYDQEGRLASVSEGSGTDTRTTTLAYNAAGLPASSTDPLGGTTTFVYDTAGRVTRQTVPTGQALFFSYDAAGNRVSTTDAQGIRTTYEYDLQDRLVAQTRDPNGRAVRTEFSYDAADNLLVQLDDAGPGRLNVATRYSYTPIGSSYAVSSITNPLGQRTKLAYTPFGALQSTTDPLGHTSLMTYTAQGWLAEVTTPSGRIVRTTYDAQGLPISVTDPRGGTSVSAYDSLGRLRSITAGAAAVGDQPALNQTIAYSYDLNGRIVGITNPAGQTSMRAYDSFGRIAAIADPLGNTTSFAYDALDRVVSKTVGANTPSQALHTTYSYDAAGRLLSERVDPSGLNLLTQYHYTHPGSSDTWSLQEIVDPKGQATGFHFNSLGQRDQTIDARGQIWRFTSDNLGRLASQTDPLGHMVSYQVDPLGRTLALTEDGRTERRSYRADGSLANMIDFAGRTTSFSYDQDGRMLGIDYPAGTPDVAYTYDDAGNLTAMADGLGSTSYTYDALNRLRQRSRDGRTVGYSYDANSQTAQIDYWGTGTVDYSYDSAGRMASLTPWGARPTTYAYRDTGQLAQQTRGNGVTTSYSYDSAGRLTSILHAAGMTNLDSLQYLLDPNGNRTQLIDGDGTTSFGYDELNRLTSAAYPAIPGGPGASSVPYSLDALGNRLSDGATAYSYDVSSRIASPGYSYDDNGNLLSDGTTSYSYDAADRLIQSVKGGVTTSYGYDGKGNLIRETVGGVTTDFVLDERGSLPLILGEVRSDGSELRYAYGSEGISAQQTISNTTETLSYPLLDALGSVRRLTDTNGTVTLTRSYDAFGTIRHSAGPGWTMLGYTGERMGVADGTLYLRARHYSPALGRFLQRDSYAGTSDRTQSLNRYAYTENNPATLTDPSGHCPLCISVAGGAAIGAGFEYGSQVYQNYQSGKSGWEAWTHVRGDKIAVAAVQGAVAGGVGFFAGPLVAGLTKMGPAVSIAAGAVEGMVSNGLGQLAVNALWHCDWNSNLLQSMLSGAASGGLGGAVGWVAKQTKAAVSKTLGEVFEDSTTLSPAESTAVETNLVSRRRLPSNEEVFENGGLPGMPRSPEAAEEAAYAARHLLRKPGEPWILTMDDVIVMTHPPAPDGSQTIYTPTKALVDQYADDWFEGLAKVRQIVVAAAERDGYNVP